MFPPKASSMQTQCNVNELVLHRLKHHGKCNILYMSYRTSLCLCRMYRTVPTVLGPTFSIGQLQRGAGVKACKRGGRNLSGRGGAGTEGARWCQKVRSHPYATWRRFPRVA